MNARVGLLVIFMTMSVTSVMAQVDQQRAAVYFKEAAALCEREGGRLWGVSLCGPMVFADPVTRTRATSLPAPDAPPPPALGFANAAVNWGGVRWATFVWSWVPADERLRGRLMIHELFHRIQPELGLFLNDGENEHLDTLDGRYWLQLEWRALARALGSAGSERSAAVRDALAFRQTRRAMFPGAAENERRLEINEGLAQYTGTVVASASAAAAVTDAIAQLSANEKGATFVRTFPYPLGVAYGLLLDAWSPGWTRRVKSADDLGQLVMAAAGLQPAENAASAAARYDGAALRIAEEKRDLSQKARVAELRRRFVEGPVVVLPNGTSNSFVTDGMMPIPGAGTIYPKFRTSGEWGSLEAAEALMAPDRSKLTVPGPFKIEGSTLVGDGWTLKAAPGWIARPGSRAGDFELTRGSMEP